MVPSPQLSSMDTCACVNFVSGYHCPIVNCGLNIRDETTVVVVEANAEEGDAPDINIVSMYTSKAPEPTDPVDTIAKK